MGRRKIGIDPNGLLVGINFRARVSQFAVYHTQIIVGRSKFGIDSQDFPMGLDFELSKSYEQGGSFAKMKKVKL